MSKRIVSNWNIMRLFRLVLGIVILVQGIQAKDWPVLLLGILFTLLPVLNVGCCAGGACATPRSRPRSDESEDLQFEELR